MSRDEIITILNQIFCEVFDDDTLKISEQTTAKDIEDWDSLAQIDMILQIETEFHIKFELKDVEHMVRVGDMIDSIQSKTSPGLT